MNYTMENELCCQNDSLKKKWNTYFFFLYQTYGMSYQSQNEYNAQELMWSYIKKKITKQHIELTLEHG